MSCVPILVIPIEAAWVIERENVRLGQNQSKDLALRAATSQALLIRERGRAARVSVRDEYGNVCTEYCLCKDFKIAII